MAEPVHEQIAAAIKTQLETIIADGGTTFWYTPDVVVRCLEWLSSYDVSKDHVLYLRPDPDEVSEGTSGGRLIGEAPFSILIVKKDERASRHPFDEANSEDPIAATVIARCVADVRAALFSDVTLGGAAWNVATGPVTADYSYQIGGAWLCAVLSFTVRYDYAA